MRHRDRASIFCFGLTSESLAPGLAQVPAVNTVINNGRPRLELARSSIFVCVVRMMYRMRAG